MEFVRYDAQEEDGDKVLACADGGDIEGLGGDFHLIAMTSWVTPRSAR